MSFVKIRLADLDKAIANSNSYHENEKDIARKFIRTSLVQAYQEAAETPILHEMLLASAQRIADLEFEIEHLKASLRLRPKVAQTHKDDRYPG